jgi:hypothetical protein
MRRSFIVGLLLGLNFVLAGFLIAALITLKERMLARDSGDLTERVAAPSKSTMPERAQVQPRAPVQATLFARMYSENPKEFTANLRAIRCPEETVRDIITAEIGRKYRAEEDWLRPKPADHVPMDWSSATSEGRLLQRRLEIAALARKKAGEAGEALGYSVPISLPLYATTPADQRFEAEWANLPEPKRARLNRAQDDYWSKTSALQERTRGFWQSEDYAELQRLKTEWLDQIKRIREAQ